MLFEIHAWNAARTLMGGEELALVMVVAKVGRQISYCQLTVCLD